MTSLITLSNFTSKESSFDCKLSWIVTNNEIMFKEFVWFYNRINMLPSGNPLWSKASSCYDISFLFSSSHRLYKVIFGIFPYISSARTMTRTLFISLASSHPYSELGKHSMYAKFEEHTAHIYTLCYGIWDEELQTNCCSVRINTVGALSYSISICFNNKYLELFQVQ